VFLDAQNINYYYSYSYYYYYYHYHYYYYYYYFYYYYYYYSYYYYYYQLRTLLLNPNIFKASHFTPSEEVPISFKSFLLRPSTPEEDDLLSV
jgi:hypothetical protein